MTHRAYVCWSSQRECRSTRLRLSATNRKLTPSKDEDTACWTSSRRGDREVPEFYLCTPQPAARETCVFQSRDDECVEGAPSGHDSSSKNGKKTVAKKGDLERINASGLISAKKTWWSDFVSFITPAKSAKEGISKPSAVQGLSSMSKWLMYSEERCNGDERPCSVSGYGACEKVSEDIRLYAKTDSKRKNKWSRCVQSGVASKFKSDEQHALTSSQCFPARRTGNGRCRSGSAEEGASRLKKNPKADEHLQLSMLKSLRRSLFLDEIAEDDEDASGSSASPCRDKEEGVSEFGNPGFGTVLAESDVRHRDHPMSQMYPESSSQHGVVSSAVVAHPLNHIYDRQPIQHLSHAEQSSSCKVVDTILVSGSAHVSMMSDGSQQTVSLPFGADEDDTFGEEISFFMNLLDVSDDEEGSTEANVSITRTIRGNDADPINHHVENPRHSVDSIDVSLQHTHGNTELCSSQLGAKSVNMDQTRPPHLDLEKGFQTGSDDLRCTIRKSRPRYSVSALLNACVILFTILGRLWLVTVRSVRRFKRGVDNLVKPTASGFAGHDDFLRKTSICSETIELEEESVFLIDRGSDILSPACQSSVSHCSHGNRVNKSDISNEYNSTECGSAVPAGNEACCPEFQESETSCSSHYLWSM